MPAAASNTGLDAFRSNWQLPFRAAFTERDYRTERFIEDGEWVSCFGSIEATHSGRFMGIEPTGKRVTIPYMDFWHVRDGRIADNWVSVDFAHVLAQLGVDVFDGEGWEAYDRGRARAARPGTEAGRLNARTSQIRQTAIRALRGRRQSPRHRRSHARRHRSARRRRRARPERQIRRLRARQLPPHPRPRSTRSSPRSRPATWRTSNSPRPRSATSPRPSATPCSTSRSRPCPA